MFVLSEAAPASKRRVSIASLLYSVWGENRDGHLTECQEKMNVPFFSFLRDVGGEGHMMIMEDN